MRAPTGECGVSAVGTAGERLLALPVRLNGIQLGRPVDIALDLAHGRALGLDVLCGDERRRWRSSGERRSSATAAGLAHSPMS